MVSVLRTFLMVLIAVRLLMPPGICVCKWTSPAARLLVALMNEQRQVPLEQERDDDDHDAGCPASPLAVGMGVKPSTEPLLPPTLVLDPLPCPAMPLTAVASTETVPDSIPFDTSPASLYLTFRTLLI